MKNNKQKWLSITSLVAAIIFLIIPLAIGFTYNIWVVKTINIGEVQYSYLDVTTITLKGWGTPTQLARWTNELGINFNSHQSNLLKFMGINSLFVDLYTITVCMFVFSLLSTAILGAQLYSPSLFKEEKQRTKLKKYGSIIVKLLTFTILLLSILMMVGSCAMVSDVNKIINIINNSPKNNKFTIGDKTYISGVLGIVTSLVLCFINLNLNTKYKLTRTKND